MPQRHFTKSERTAFYDVIGARRDIRHFIPGATIQPDTLARLLAAAHAGPSVGLMQPWRFVRITDGDVRRRLHAVVEEERVRTAHALGERSDEFMRLKVEGVLDCAELLVVGLCDDRERHIFGRRTMPAMDLASVACAIENLWLAARAENLGMGWVSIFSPADVAAILSMPPGAQPVAMLCLGPAQSFPDRPLLEIEQWTTARPLDDFVSENRWA
ncbi:5,6-dimethylbenzimidazole synthase [Gordonia jinhuaensis]|uniref:5,6-dimethylbenzimidazole synthase n=1 Tax=Gordonia jinhuaensis TaxID=1517702 RepID=A0A916WTH3_9ACTN|nr:5,6-dimethylbenzimidazole synthase [Gordonia jinhuaensis]GGB29090.1 5,6-dimethylbenzimidazole synthase [Gordonia jinhuaensis]